MKTKEIIERSRKFAAPYSVTDGKKFRLKDIDANAGGDPARFDRFTALADAIEDFQGGASPR